MDGSLSCEHGVLIITGQQVSSGDIVSRYQSLNFVENRPWIKRRHFRFQAVCFEPDRVPVGLSGLGATRLPHVGTSTACSKGNQLMDVEVHSVCNSYDDLEIRLCAAELACFL